LAEKYHVVLTEKAKKSLKKLDKHTALLITAWLRKNLEGCTDPYQYGKGLTANRSGQWRYRIGDYRLVCEISEQTITILVLNIGHRKEIYKH
jgi:mRNA interferase RelE/StbE